MRPGMRTLLDLLRGEAHRSPLAAEECLSVLALAGEENILPWTAACLRAQVAQRSAALEARLHAIEREARISAFLWSETLRRTLTEFHRCGVAAIPLKGPWLAQRLYGDAALRLYCDLDLLVRKRDFARAEAALRGLGFTPDARRDDYARTWRRGGITLELHDDVENPLAFDFGIDGAWARAQRAEFEGAPAWLLAPADELRFLALHGARHRFERLSHVLDLVLALRHLPLAGGHAPDRMLALGCMMAARLAPDVAEFADQTAGVPDRSSLEEMAERLWQERMRAAAPVLDWRTKHSFLLSVERRGWRRLRAGVRHLQILSTRLIADDFAFAARLHLYRKWQVWLLRPVRLLLEAGEGSTWARRTHLKLEGQQ